MYLVSKDELTPNELAVWELIDGRIGQAKAITSIEIESKTGLNRFQTCKVIQSLRLKHRVPIVTNKFGTSKRGYFLPANKEEVANTIGEMVKQAETLLSVVEVLESARV